MLRFLSQSDATHRRIDQAPAAACTTCALRERCTTSPRGRRISRNLDEPYRDRVRGDHTTEPSAKAMRKRQVGVEPLFAEATTWHGLRRFRLRGLAQVNGEALLIAAGQNLKRLLSRWGWGRRPFPRGAAGAVLVRLRPTVVAAPLTAVLVHDRGHRLLGAEHPFAFFNTLDRFGDRGRTVLGGSGTPRRGLRSVADGARWIWRSAPQRTRPCAGRGCARWCVRPTSCKHHVVATLPVFFVDVAGANRQAVLTASAIAWPHRARPR